MFNVHTHLFTSNHVPEELLKLYVKWLPNFAIKRVSTFMNSNAGNFLLGWTNRLGNEPLKRYGNFMKFGYGMNVEEQFQILKAAYPKGTRFVVLMQDFAYISDYQSVVSFDDYKKEIYHLKRKFPDILLPFHFVEPRSIGYNDNPDRLLDPIKKDYERGFCQGLKIYPAQGYFPFDYRMLSVYKYAVENKIPVMTHVSKGGSRYVKQTSDVDKNILKLDGKIYQTGLPKLGWFNKDYTGRAAMFSDPENYKKVLDHEGLRDLKICLAHAGGDEDFNIALENLKLPTNQQKNNWYKTCLHLIDHYPNVYMDISFSLHNPDFLEKLIKKDFILRDDELEDIVMIKKKEHRRERLLFGTDYYMTYTEFDSSVKNLSLIEYDLWKKAENILGSELFKLISVENPTLYLKSKKYR